MYVVVKLVSGAELIAEMTSKSQSSIVLKNPFQVIYSSTNFGVPSVTVQKFCPFAKVDVYEFHLSHVMCLNEISDSSVMYYKAAIESLKSPSEHSTNEAHSVTKPSKGYMVH